MRDAVPEFRSCLLSRILDSTNIINQPKKQKPEALRINSLSGIKIRILLLRNCSYVMLIIYLLPCITHIKSSKAHCFVICKLCTPTRKNAWEDWILMVLLQWCLPLGNNKYMAYLPVKLDFSFFSVTGFTRLALAFHIELQVDTNKCFFLVIWFCSKRVTEISRVGQNKKGFIKLIMINPQSVAREIFLQLHCCNLSSKPPKISSKNNSEKLSWPAGVDIIM